MASTKKLSTLCQKKNHLNISDIFSLCPSYPAYFFSLHNFHHYCSELTKSSPSSSLSVLLKLKCHQLQGNGLNFAIRQT